jgi:hypothetical protein
MLDCSISIGPIETRFRSFSAPPGGKTNTRTRRMMGVFPAAVVAAT